MELKFRLNDRVMLTSSAMSKYGNQSNGLSGVVVFAGERKNDVTRPYLVMWDKQKGPANSYMEEDLKLAGFKFQVVGEEEEVPVPESFHRSFNQVMFKAMFAPPIMDEGETHAFANNCASRIMMTLFQVDTSAFSEFKPLHSVVVQTNLNDYERGMTLEEFCRDKHDEVEQFKA